MGNGNGNDGNKGIIERIQDASNEFFEGIGNKFKRAIGMPEQTDPGRDVEMRGIGGTMEQPKTSMSKGGGNPCHYGTHIGEKKGMNRQGRSKGKTTCHHGK